MIKKCLMFFSLLVVFLLANPAEASSPFKDVPTSNQFYSSIEWATNNGLLKGYADGTFKPQNYLTEAQFTTILARYLNPIVTNGASAEYERFLVYDYIESYNLPIKGIANPNARNNTFTRLDVARVFATLATGKNVTDSQAIDWMYEAGITTGKGVSSDKYIDFGGNDPLKREHIASFFKRLDDSSSFNYPNLSRDIFVEASKRAPSNYKLTDLKQATFVPNNGTDQYIGKYERNGTFLFQVLTYNQNTNSWSVSFKEATEREDLNLNMKVISIGNNLAETQVLLYTWEGSGHYLTAFVLGYHNGSYHLESVPTELDHDFIVKNRILQIYEGQTARKAYRWSNGKLTETAITPLQPNPGDLIITYDLDKNNVVHSNVGASGVINAKVGQGHFYQQKYTYLDDYIVRVLVSGDPDIIDDATGKFVKEGTVHVTILPNGYDWDDAYEFYIRVTK